MAIMKPAVNINGTSKEELLKVRIVAMEAIYSAMQALTDLKPHGRDYIGKDHQYSLDRAVWTERFTTLDKLRNEVLEEALAIQEGGN